jgi:bifunctional UDP-N-acetylglucosamine pyrophosphorylase/glucosamine-1-phosphate N-acetyltransferase
MKVVFLCGGIGKRMFPIIEDKFMLKFLGKTLLERHIELAKKAGLDGFIIVGNPDNVKKIKKATQNIPGIKIGVQEEPKGMANALESVKDLIGNDKIIVVKTNDVFDESAYERILAAHKKGPDFSYILGYNVKEYFPGGYLVVDREGNLKKIEEKPGPGNEPSVMINIVVHLHANTKELFDYIKKVKTEKDDQYERAITEMIKNGYKFKVVRYDGFWSAIQYPWHIFKIAKHFLDGLDKPYISERAKIDKTARIEGNVYIEDGVKVLENAVVRGPCYIGKDSVIGNNVLIWNYSHIGERCIVGYNTEIKHSYVGKECWFHSNYIGDSIIGEQCSFGAGTVTANFRFDEKNVVIRHKGMVIDTGLDKFGAIIGSNSKTGINVSIMPGVRLGPNSFVGPHVILRKDLEPNKTILCEHEYKIVENKIELSEDKKRELRKRLERL